MGRFKKPEPITSDHSTAQVNNQRLGWGGQERKKIHMAQTLSTADSRLREPFQSVGTS